MVEPRQGLNQIVVAVYEYLRNCKTSDLREMLEVAVTLSKNSSYSKTYRAKDFLCMAITDELLEREKRLEAKYSPNGHKIS